MALSNFQSHIEDLYGANPLSIIILQLFFITSNVVLKVSYSLFLNVEKEVVNQISCNENLITEIRSYIESSCLFILSLIICDFIDLYSGNIKPIPMTQVSLSLGFLKKAHGSAISSGELLKFVFRLKIFCNDFYSTGDLTV
ncbi:hypothetical protein H8356DRAFT_1349062 [Neocallimastix lanati (nom. inval.)]|nr:hypothetical protein H8356DRAFT_1349062 [Neocallimastix sp. JGI-2020a]